MLLVRLFAASSNHFVRNQTRWMGIAAAGYAAAGSAEFVEPVELVEWFELVELVGWFELVVLAAMSEAGLAELVGPAGPAGLVLVLVAAVIAVIAGVQAPVAAAAGAVADGVAAFAAEPGCLRPGCSTLQPAPARTGLCWRLY